MAMWMRETRSAFWAAIAERQVTHATLPPLVFGGGVWRTSAADVSGALVLGGERFPTEVQQAIARVSRAGG